jgi:hypothetical protein
MSLRLGCLQVRLHGKVGAREVERVLPVRHVSPYCRRDRGVEGKGRARTRVGIEIPRIERSAESMIRCTSGACGRRCAESQPGTRPGCPRSANR